MMEVTEKKQFYAKLRQISLPIVFQSLMLSLVAAADALMLGRVSQGEMTAVSLATQVQFVQNMFLFSLTEGGVILGAQYWGKGDGKTLSKLFSLMLRVSGLVSLLFFCACEFVPDFLMKIFTSDAAMIETGAGYLRIAGWSYLMTGLSQCCLSVMKVSGHVGPSAAVSSGAVILNIALNAVLIFGLFGLPEMRAQGAAAATTVSRAVELGACAGLCFKKGYIRPDAKSFFRADRLLAKDYRRQYLPLMGGTLSWGIGFTSYTAIIGHMGSDAAAANSVSAVIRDLVCCACNGIGGAAGIMVGNELGAGNLERGKRYGLKLKNISFVIGFASTALVLAVTPLVINSVVLTDTAKEYLTGMMIIMSVYMIGRCVNTVTINGVLDGGGDTIFDMYSLFVSMWCIAIPLALLGAFVFKWPVLLVYSCTCLDEVGKIPWVMIRLRKFKWVRNLTR